VAQLHESLSGSRTSQAGTALPVRAYRSSMCSHPQGLTLLNKMLPSNRVTTHAPSTNLVAVGLMMYVSMVGTGS